MSELDRLIIVLDSIYTDAREFVNDYPYPREGYIFGQLVDALNALSLALAALRRQKSKEAKSE